MALSRIPGEEDLYVGGIFALRKPSTLKEKNISAILSVIDFSFVKWEEIGYRFAHLSIDIDDMDDVDIVVHMPKMVRFIERGLYGDAAFPDEKVKQGHGRRGPGQSPQDVDAITPIPENPDPTAVGRSTGGSHSHPSTDPSTSPKPGAVFVHCAMGKSRSVTAIIAYLLWKHPYRYEPSSTTARPDRAASAGEAVSRALKWVQQARPVAEPNSGFMKQLELWWTMGCPADSDDAVDHHPVYQRWLYRRELEESRAAWRAPGWVIFEDESVDGSEGKRLKDSAGSGGDGGVEIRCKLCRRVLATQGFILPHQAPTAASFKGKESQQQQTCPHVFIEPLSWMRPMLENGALDGRLMCPSPKCSATVGRFTWQGFRCSCGEWVCPAFSLNRAKVDEVAVGPGIRAGGGDGRGPLGHPVGIRVPPGAGSGDANQKENL